MKIRKSFISLFLIQPAIIHTDVAGNNATNDDFSAGK